MRTLYFVAIAAFFVALTSFSPAPAPAQNDKAKAKDMAELTKLFAANNVTIMLNYNSTAITGTITGTRELFGKQYLLIANDAGRVTLVDIYSIAAIRQDR